MEMKRIVAILGLLAAVLAATIVGCSGEAHITVKLDDGQTLRVWDVEELPEIESIVEEGVTLLDLVDISLACKDYEGDNYEFIDACRAVPEGARWTKVEIRGADESVLLVWERVAQIFERPITLEIEDGKAKLVEALGDLELEEVEEVVITLQ